MNLSAHHYAIAAFYEACVNQLDHRIMWAAILCATKDNPKTDCEQLDDNVQAAIQAKEWLKSLHQ